MLEAQHRVGGRTLTAHLDESVFIDDGGQWVSPNQGRIVALASELNVELFPSWGQGKMVLVREGERHVSDDLFLPANGEARTRRRRRRRSSSRWPLRFRSMPRGGLSTRASGTPSACTNGGGPIARARAHDGMLHLARLVARSWFGGIAATRVWLPQLRTGVTVLDSRRSTALARCRHEAAVVGWRAERAQAVPTQAGETECPPLRGSGRRRSRGGSLT